MLVPLASIGNLFNPGLDPKSKMNFLYYVLRYITSLVIHIFFIICIYS